MGVKLHLVRQSDPYWEPLGQPSLPEKCTERSSYFINFCIWGNVFLSMNPLCTMGVFPDEIIAKPAKLLSSLAITYFRGGLAPSSQTVESSGQQNWPGKSSEQSYNFTYLSIHGNIYFCRWIYHVHWVYSWQKKLANAPKVLSVNCPESGNHFVMGIVQHPNQCASKFFQWNSAL